MTRVLFQRLCRARDLISQHGWGDDEAPPSVAEVARRVGISRFHFIRRFEALFGVTPHQLRMRVRLDRARDLLAEEHSVTAVCMEVGFSSLGSFSDLFTRRIGVPPSLYRRRAHAAPPGCLTLLGLLPEDAFRNSEEASRGAPGKIAASTRRTQRGNA